MATSATMPVIPIEQDRYLSTREASIYLGFKNPDTLKTYREQGIGPVYSRLNRRTCRYRLSDLIRFCVEHRAEQSND
jgi:hypothetical protein